MKNSFKNPIFTFILGAIIFSFIGTYAASSINATGVLHSNTSVKSYLDNLRNLFNNYCVENLSSDSQTIKQSVSGGNYKMNTSKTIMLTDKGIFCLKENGKVKCFLATEPTNYFTSCSGVGTGTVTCENTNFEYSKGKLPGTSPHIYQVKDLKANDYCYIYNLSNNWQGSAICT